jgi:LmbE family N-acetylglucosaminyl deacetylase
MWRLLKFMRHLRPMVQADAVLNALRELPLTDCSSLLGDQPVLVLAPHPDDESLGCGGLMAECQMQGRDVHVLVLTDGTGSHPQSREFPARRLAALRMAEARAAITALGLPENRIEFLGLPDGQAPVRGKRFDAAIARVAEHARARRIGTICTTWPHDPHHDHYAAYRIGQQVARDIGAKLLCYPVWGWTISPDTWLPAMQVRGARLDITHHLAAKRRAIACHRSQLTDLIRDDPTGFRLAPEVLSYFDSPFEVFCEP